MACAAVADKVDTPFPLGLKILVVDDDPLCLMVVERMLKRCNYKVTTCTRAREALRILREKTGDGFDLVLSDVYMPDMDGMKLLEHIGLELDLPVIIMSSNGETETVLRGVTHGAVDYLVKPVRMEELRNIWQHVIRRRSSTKVKADPGESPDGEKEEEGEGDGAQPRAKKQKKDAEPEEVAEEEGQGVKKPRVVWSVELHQQFVNAVNQLGMDKAVPKRILDLMGVSGLTRENVASHLQKYRMYLKRIGSENTGSLVVGHGGVGLGGMGVPMMVGQGAVTGMMANNMPMQPPPMMPQMQQQGYMIPGPMQGGQGMQMGVPSMHMPGPGMVQGHIGGVQPHKQLDMSAGMGMSGGALPEAPGSMMGVYPGQYPGDMVGGVSAGGGQGPGGQQQVAMGHGLQDPLHRNMPGGHAGSGGGSGSGSGMDDMLLSSFLRSDDGKDLFGEVDGKGNEGIFP